jgi:hypothetical protein
MSERKDALAEYMRRSHDASWSVLSSLKDDDLAHPVFGDGEAKWSVGDLVGHLADAEPGILGQVRRLLAGKATVPEDFDLNRWNRSAVRRSRGRSLPDLLNEILTAHRAALETLGGVEEPSLDWTGRHASGDILTVEGFFRRMVDHRRDHTADIRRALDSGAGSP